MRPRLIFLPLLALAAVAVRLIVEFVHYHIVNRRLRPLAQRHVREDLRRAAQDRRIAVHRRVARAQAHILRAEFPAQRQPLLIHQRLHRARVHRAPPMRHGLEMQRRRHQRFPRPRRRVQDHIAPVEQFQNRILLRRIERDASRRDVVEKTIQQDRTRRLTIRRQPMVEIGWALRESVRRSPADGQWIPNRMPPDFPSLRRTCRGTTVRRFAHLRLSMILLNNLSIRETSASV